MKVSSGFTLTNVETQSRTVVTGLAAFLPITPLPSPPPLDITVRLLACKREWDMTHVVEIATWYITRDMQRWLSLSGRSWRPLKDKHESKIAILISVYTEISTRVLPHLSVLFVMQMHVWVRIHGGQCYTANPWVWKGQTGRERQSSERGNSGQSRVFHRCTNEPRDTQTGNCSIVLPPCPGQQILYSYWHTETHVHSVQDIQAHTDYHIPCKATHKHWSVFSVSVRHTSTKMIFVTSWSESRRWKRLHLFRKLLGCCKVFCLTSWHALKELGWAVQGCLLWDKHNRPQPFGPRPDSFCSIIITCLPSVIQIWAMA